MSIEENIQLKAKLYTVSETCKLLNMTIFNFYHGYKNNGFFRTLQEIDGQLYLDKEEVNSLVEENKEYNQMTDFMTTKQAAESLNLHEDTIIRLLNRGMFPNAKKTRFYSSPWKIPFNDLSNYNKLLGNVKVNYCDLQETSIILSLSIENLKELIKNNFFPNTFKTKGGDIKIPKKDIVYYMNGKIAEKNSNNECDIEDVEKVIDKNLNFLENLKNNYLKSSDVSKHFQVSPNIINKRVKEGLFENIIKHGRFIYISKDEVFNSVSKEDIQPSIIKSSYKKENIDENYFRVIEVAKYFNVSESTIRKRMNEKLFSNIVKHNNITYISKEEVINNISKEDILTKRDNISASLKSKNETLKKNYLSVEEISVYFDIPKYTIRERIKEGIFTSAIKHGKFHYVLKEEVFSDAIKEKLLIRENLQSNYLKVSEVANYFNVSTHMISQKIKDGTFKTVLKYGTAYYLLKKEVYNDINFKDLSGKQFKPYIENESIDDRFNYILRLIDNTDIIPETISLYKEYLEIKYSNTERRTKNAYSTSLMKTLWRFSSLLNKEIFLFNDTEIVELLSNKQLTILDKKYLVGFLNYVSAIKEDCVYKNKYNFSTKLESRTDKDIYTKEEFKILYSYSRDIELHKDKALSDRFYAEVWFYVIMHFINAWRSSDIIDFPMLDTEFVKNLSLKEISEMNLSTPDAQLIINSVSETWERFTINKTGGLNKFLVNMDMVNPMGTVLLILMFHQHNNPKEKLLSLENSTIKSKYLKRFFELETNNIKFESLKTNRSLLTYFFNNVAQGSKNGDVAHLLAQRMRGHMDSDTVSQYVMNTNEDDYIDDISYNLFRRGHFGWLYHSLIDIVVNSKDKNLTTEEKTLLIEQYQKHYSPRDIESLSKFFLTQQNKNHSIAVEIALLSEKELEEKLKRIYFGHMPSKEENGQCFFSRDCKSPNGNCLTCPYLIPRVYLLTSLKTEIQTKLQTLKDVKEYEIVERMRTTYILFKLLNLLNQSVVSFGKEYINSFVNIQELKSNLIEIDDKILLSERRVDS